MKQINSKSAIENCEAVLAQVSEIVKSSVEYQKNEYRKGNDEAYKYLEKMIVDDDKIGVYVDMAEKEIEVLVYGNDNQIIREIKVRKTSESRCPRVDAVASEIMNVIIEMGTEKMNKEMEENKMENKTFTNFTNDEMVDIDYITREIVDCATYAEENGYAIDGEEEFELCGRRLTMINYECFGIWCPDLSGHFDNLVDSYEHEFLYHLGLENPCDYNEVKLAVTMAFAYLKENMEKDIAEKENEIQNWEKENGVVDFTPGLAPVVEEDKDDLDVVSADLYMRSLKGNKIFGTVAKINKVDVYINVDLERKMLVGKVDDFYLSADLESADVPGFDKALAELKRKMEYLADEYAIRYELSYNEDMTEEEIDVMVKDIKEALKERFGIVVSEDVKESIREMIEDGEDGFFEVPGGFVLDLEGGYVTLTSPAGEITEICDLDEDDDTEVSLNKITEVLFKNGLITAFDKENIVTGEGRENEVMDRINEEYNDRFDAAFDEDMSEDEIDELQKEIMVRLLEENGVDADIMDGLEDYERNAIVGYLLSGVGVEAGEPNLWENDYGFACECVGNQYGVSAEVVEKICPLRKFADMSNGLVEDEKENYEDEL